MSFGRPPIGDILHDTRGTGPLGIGTKLGTGEKSRPRGAQADSDCRCLDRGHGVALSGAAADAAAGDQGEESLDLIEPGTARRSEVEMEPLPLLGPQPTLNLTLP